MDYKKVKRFFDIILSLTLIVILSPLFIIIPLTLQLTNDTKKIGYFKQKRTGINGKEFYIYKFRSVIVKNNIDHVTKYGSFLRKFGIDELPQLINILKGDMSFIGPRPRPISYYEYYTDEQKEKFSVLPGILNPVISNDKENASILEKIDLEVEYAKKCNLKYDLLLIKDILINLPSIVSNRNISSHGNIKNLNNDLDILKENYMKWIDKKQYNKTNNNFNDKKEELINVKVNDISKANLFISDEQLEYYETMLNNYTEPELYQGPKLVKKINSNNKTVY